MAIVQWNIRGLHANLEQVRLLFKEANANVICLQETKLGENSPSLGLNYALYRSPPFIGECSQGGTAFVVHKSLNHRPLLIQTPLQACAIQIYMKKWITLCSLYLEPKLEDHLLDDTGFPRHLDLNDLQSLVDQLPTPYILMGDFNAKHTLWGGNICDRWGNIIEKLIDQNDII